MYHGVLMQVLATIKVLVWAYIVMPLDPRQQRPPLQVCLFKLASLSNYDP